MLYLSSHFNHLWRNGFLSFNKLLLCYLFLFTIKCEALLTEELLSIFENYILHILTYSRICRGNLPREFAAGICRGYLPWEFVVGICRKNLPREFAAGVCRICICICKQILFCICEQMLFRWKQTFFICKQNFFICEIFFINNVSFCYCRGCYGPPYIFTYKKI